MRKFLMFASLLLLSLSVAFADVQQNFVIDGLHLSRTLAVKPIGNYDSSTGAVKMQQESIIALTVFNPGPIDRQNVSIEEDLNYLPPNARLAFSFQPESDGRTARWMVPLLSAGQSFTVWFSLPASVPDGAVGKLGPMRVHTNKPLAALFTPNVVERGDSVSLRLRTPDGLPLPGVTIRLNAPDGARTELVTDESGRATFNAEQSGFYTYQVQNFEVGFAPSTESRGAILPSSETEGAITPVAPALAKNDDLGNAIGRLWPLGLGILVVGAIALILYGFLAGGPSNPEERLPPAPATRPLTERGVEQLTTVPSLSEITPVAQTSVQASTPSGQRSAGVVPSSASSAPISDPDAIAARTRSMIARRRAMGQEDEADEEKPQMPDEAELEDGETGVESAADEKPARFTEETMLDLFDENGDVKKSDDVEPQSEVHEPGVRSLRGGRPSPPPHWMTDEQAPEGEAAEIDDDAIRKTIEELEQLRSELATRSKESGGKRSVPFRKMSADEGGSEKTDVDEVEDENSEEGDEPDASQTSPRIVPIQPDWEEKESGVSAEPKAPKPTRRRLDEWGDLSRPRAEVVRKAAKLPAKSARTVRAPAKPARLVRSAPIRSSKKGVRHQSEKAVGKKMAGKKKGRR